MPQCVAVIIRPMATHVAQGAMALQNLQQVLAKIKIPRLYPSIVARVNFTDGPKITVNPYSSLYSLGI
jgi:hypothetical protein